MLLSGGDQLQARSPSTLPFESSMRIRLNMCSWSSPLPFCIDTLTSAGSSFHAAPLKKSIAPPTRPFIPLRQHHRLRLVARRRDFDLVLVSSWQLDRGAFPTCIAGRGRCISVLPRRLSGLGLERAEEAEG
jgi:hypothetical protein